MMTTIGIEAIFSKNPGHATSTARSIVHLSPVEIPCHLATLGRCLLRLAATLASLMRLQNARMIQKTLGSLTGIARQ